jgi:hypothetical protein
LRNGFCARDGILVVRAVRPSRSMPWKGGVGSSQKSPWSI